MRLRSTELIFGLTALAIVVAAATTTLVLADANAEQADVAAAAGATIPVRVSIVAEHTAASAGPVTATGTLRAARELPQAFAVGGVVDHLHAEEGAAVAAGEVLATLDPVPFAAEVDRVAARLAFLDARLARSEELLAAQAVSAEEVDADRAERAALAAQLRQARWQQERASLRAPFAARVLRRTVELGQVVSPGAPAFELLAVDTLEVTVAVSARRLRDLDLRAPIGLTVPDRPGRRYPATLDHEPVSGDVRSGSVPVTVRVANPAGELLPGLLASCEFAARDEAFADARLEVPVSAVRVGGAGPVVFALDGDRVREVPVAVARVRDDHIEVTRGLRAGMRVVTDAPDRLRDGDPVQAREDS